jgi:hypothetical protein
MVAERPWARPCGVGYWGAIGLMHEVHARDGTVQSDVQRKNVSFPSRSSVANSRVPKPVLFNTFLGNRVQDIVVSELLKELVHTVDESTSAGAGSGSRQAWLHRSALLLVRRPGTLGRFCGARSEQGKAAGSAAYQKIRKRPTTQHGDASQPAKRPVCFRSVH